MPHTRHVPVGVTAPTCQEGGAGVWGAGLGLDLGLGTGFGGRGGPSSLLLSKWRGFLGFLGSWGGGGLVALRGGVLAPLVVISLFLLRLLLLLLLLPVFLDPHPTATLRVHPPHPSSFLLRTYPTCNAPRGPCWGHSPRCGRAR